MYAAPAAPTWARPAIVIFGAAVRPNGEPSTTLLRRVQAAALFGRTLAMKPLYIPTGAKGRYGASEASVMGELLRDLGVTRDAILLEERGADTLSSVREVARLLHALPPGAINPVYAATSAYHLPRCVMLLRLAGLPARASRPPPFPAARCFRARWFWRLREAAALPYDLVAILALRASGRL